eukprot:1868176-Pyramimonas_sp.AAC.1
MLLSPQFRHTPRVPPILLSSFLRRFLLGEREPLGVSQKLLQTFLRLSGGLLGAFWEHLGASSGHQASSRGRPERPGHDLECVGGRLGAILGRHGAL